MQVPTYNSLFFPALEEVVLAATRGSVKIGAGRKLKINKCATPAAATAPCYRRGPAASRRRPRGDDCEPRREHGTSPPPPGAAPSIFQLTKAHSASAPRRLLITSALLLLLLLLLPRPAHTCEFTCRIQPRRLRTYLLTCSFLPFLSFFSSFSNASRSLRDAV